MGKKINELYYHYYTPTHKEKYMYCIVYIRLKHLIADNAKFIENFLIIFLQKKKKFARRV